MKIAKTLLGLALVLLISAMMACGEDGGGGDGTSGGGTAVVDAAGDWSGTFSIRYSGDYTMYSTSISASIAQNGNAVSGSFILGGRYVYNFSGGISDAGLTLDYHGVDCSDSGHITGSAGSDGMSMEFTGTGNTGNCTPSNTDYAVTAQLSRN